jgi:hypothetical protein
MNWITPGIGSQWINKFEFGLEFFIGLFSYSFLELQLSFMIDSKCDKFFVESQSIKQHMNADRINQTFFLSYIHVKNSPPIKMLIPYDTFGMKRCECKKIYEVKMIAARLPIFL